MNMTIPACMCCAIAAWTATATAAPQFQMTPLQGVGQDYEYVFDFEVSPSGKFALAQVNLENFGTTGMPGIVPSYRWDLATTQIARYRDRDLDGGLTDEDHYAVDDTGTVWGSQAVFASESATVTTVRHPVRSASPGAVPDVLPALQPSGDVTTVDTSAAVYASNASGVLAGIYNGTDTNAVYGQRFVRWPNAVTGPTLLTDHRGSSRAGGNGASPTVINEAGVIASVNYFQEAVRWSPTATQGVQLDGLAASPNGDKRAEPRAIDSAGNVVGFAYADVAGFLKRQPVLWKADQTVATPLALPTGMNVGEALGISDTGLIVGYGSEAVGQFGSTNLRMLLWSDPDTVHVLADLVTNAPGWQFNSYVAGLSLNNTLVTEALDPQGQRQFVMLQLVPEPGVSIVLLAGLGLTVGIRPGHRLASLVKH